MKGLACLAALVVMLPACGAGSTDPTAAPVLADYASASFVVGIDNPYFPLAVGTTWSYEGAEDGEIERIDVVVTDQTRLVDGVTATVVRDTVLLDGELVEDTFDWYAQDTDGNVWYLGEDSTEYEDGDVVSTAGSWETGVGGALPGIIMHADPAAHLNQPYRQEFYPGEAEDVGEIVETGVSITVRGVTFTDVIVVREWNLLEPGVFENKYHAPGIGVVLEELVEGGSGRVELLETTAG